MFTKTHRTAVVVIPPREVWGTIQAIREKHDHQFRRWMPHINLLYPFRPAEQFADAVPRLADACAKVTPLAVILAEFRFFRHTSGRSTLWLAPEPKEGLVRLQASLESACPGCDDLSRFPGGFTPHLSVGQAKTVAEAQQLLDELQSTWQPIRFDVTAVALICRKQERPFEIDRWISLAVNVTLT